MSRSPFMFLPLLLVLCGCGPREGEVVDREFEPAHTYQYQVDVWDGSSSHYSYRQHRWVTENHYHTEWRTGNVPDAWFVTIQMGVGKEAKRSRFEVSHVTYDQATNGVWFSRDRGVIPHPSLEQAR